MVRTTVGRVSIVSLAVLAVACTGNGDSTAQDTTTSTSTTNTTSTMVHTPLTTVDPDAALHQEILDAYVAAIDAYMDASQRADPNDPQLLATHAGEMLELRRERLSQMTAEGRMLAFPANSVRRYELIPRAITVVDDGVMFEVCSLDDSREVDLGEAVLEGDTVVNYRHRVLMLREEESWLLVSRQTLDETVEGRLECASDW